MILQPVREKLQRSLAYAEKKYCESVLTKKIATEESERARINYESIRSQVAQVEAAIRSIEADECEATETTEAVEAESSTESAASSQCTECTSQAD